MRGDPGITCRDCGHVNPEGSRFCGHCGESIDFVCGKCGERVPSDARFCLQCGTVVDHGATDQVLQPEWRIDTQQASLEGERKQISILFADVKGSMDLAERLDPESWRELMQRFYGVLADAVRRADGTVDKFTGDGIMALFGAPVAREDHALCACRAALDMISGVEELAAQLSDEGIDLGVRIGINSGEVVVGSMGADGLEYTAIGHTVGLAQRMESQADIGTAYLSATTAALADGFFELTDLGERDIKGASAAIRVHRLDGIGSAHGHLDVSRARGLSRFVGRIGEVAELESAYERSISGTGEVIGVVAPAGVGKSRLCHEFVDRCRERGIAVYQAQCEAHTQEIPLVPVMQLLRSRFGITGLDSDAAGQAKIRTELLGLGLRADAAVGEDVSLLFDFLGIPDPDLPAIQMNGDARNRRLRQLVRRLVHATNRAPSVVLVEDLHWIDPASAAFLETLVDAIPASGGFFVANFRPEYRAAWMTGSHYRQLPLAPLPSESLQALLAELLGRDSSLDGLADLIAERTGGNPFYVEEVVRELAESGTLVGTKGAYSMGREIGDLPVPPTVQAILAARIDRLPPGAKATLQTAAAVGSEISRELLTLVVNLDEDALDAAIKSLIDSEFIHETSLYPQQVYGFRHRLTQEVAYGSQLAPARARAHTAVAIGLQTAETDRLDENSGLIAQHYEKAGDALQAAQWHLRAVFWSGPRDPMASIRHALEVVELDQDLPNGPEADGVRLTARLYVAAMGWRVGADPMTIRKAFDEGVAIAERNGDGTMLALLHASFAACPLTCEGKFIEGKRIAVEGARLADTVGDPGLQAVSKVLLIYCLWLEGLMTDVVAMCDDVIELTSDDPAIPFADAVANPRVWALTARAPSLLSLGRTEEAHEAIEQALALAADMDEEMLGWAHMFAAAFHFINQDLPVDDLVKHTEASSEIAERLGDAFSRSWSRYWNAYAALQSGQAEDAVEGFTRALEEIHDRGAGRESESLIRSGLGASLVATARLDDGIESGRSAVAVAVDQTLGLSELWARESLAGWLLDRAGPDDLEEASAHLEAAQTLAQQGGNVVFLERIAELRQRLPTPA